MRVRDGRRSEDGDHREAILTVKESWRRKHSRLNHAAPESELMAHLSSEPWSH